MAFIIYKNVNLSCNDDSACVGYVIFVEKSHVYKFEKYNCEVVCVCVCIYIYVCMCVCV